MKYMSLSSGIEAATVAWHELGWEPVLFSEIASFPSKLLNYYYPWVPNIGDMTKALKNEQFNNATADLIVAGTPCQSFSIAGLRGGLDTKNGNLALWFCRILLKKQPPWFVWENVPGVFSSYSSNKRSKVHPRIVRRIRRKQEAITETSDFAAILNAFRECGYSVSYRVLDSQHFGVPQRRRRVFVVGYLGNDWRPPAAVLFESESLRRDFTPSRKKGEEVAGTIDARTNGGGFPGSDGAVNGHVVATLDANYGKLQGASGQDLNHGHSHLVAGFMPGQGSKAGGVGYQVETAPTLKSSNSGTNLAPAVLYSIMPQNSGNDYKAREVDVAQPLMAGGPVGGNQGGDYILQPICFQQNTRDEVRLMAGDGQIAGALSSQAGMKQQNYVHTPAFQTSQSGVRISDTHATLGANDGPRRHNGIIQGASIRRLTPMECERLQGFPDNYTNIPGASDSARYKAIGNSMTTHVMRWLGERIELVNQIIESLK